VIVIDPRRCWGVYRELAHSPGRETDDAEILRATAARLAALGFEVTLKTPEEALEGRLRPPQFLFVMCERLPILERLAVWEQAGACQVNSCGAILNTYRDRMIPLFAENGVSFPHSVLIAANPAEVPDQIGPTWIKRGDVHNTQEGDVTFARDRTAAVAAVERLAARGIRRAVVQEHVAGDLIKFYGIVGRPGDPSAPAGSLWFQWFYHRDQTLAKHRFEPENLARQAVKAACALGLEVYGGDAIVTADGRVVVIDLNAWPSFALYRKAASGKIADYLAARFRKEAGVLP
jgi:hypothetical protein